MVVRSQDVCAVIQPMPASFPKARSLNFSRDARWLYRRSLGHRRRCVCLLFVFPSDQSRSTFGPIVALGRWLVKRRRRKATRGAYRSIADPTPVQVLAVEANRFDADVPFSVPLTAAVRVYFQFLPHEDVDAVIATIRESSAAFSASRSFLPRASDRVAAGLRPSVTWP